MRDIEKEFGAAYERYNDELFRHCTLRLSDRERALELTQETFLRAWEYIERGETVREMRPFLYRTLRNLIIDEYRKSKSISLESMVKESEGETVESLMPADETNTLTTAIDRFDGKLALEALREVPEPYREVLILRYIDSLTPKEIAERIDATENVVSVRIHRGLKKLRSVLEPSFLEL
ncbi:RNA polymerase sigma factor [Acetobacteraceae bacterium]|nr:RNA polymerase sigma factor [Candidatus Parcubacteria bacterium]